MNITRELIEKYHQGLCTPQEAAAIAQWLDSDEPVEAAFPEEENKFEVQDEIWKEISAAVKPRNPSRRDAFFVPFWRQAAAVLLVSAIGAAAFLMKNKNSPQGVISVANASATINKDLHESAYSISVGPKSNVEINNATGRFEFCGAVLINPKRDIELTIQGSCAKPERQREKMTLKKGHQYIALNYGSASNPGEVMVLPETSITGLPPLMQRQLMSQFNI